MKKFRKCVYAIYFYIFLKYYSKKFRRLRYQIGYDKFVKNKK